MKFFLYNLNEPSEAPVVMIQLIFNIQISHKLSLQLGYIRVICLFAMFTHFNLLPYTFVATDYIV